MDITLQAHVPPSSGKALIFSGLPLPLQLTWGFFTPKCFPMQFAIHVHPSGVHRSLSVVIEWPSVLLRNAATLQGQTLVTATLECSSSLGFWSHHSGDASSCALQVVPQGQGMFRTLPRVPLSPSSSSSSRKGPRPQEWLFRKSVIQPK